MYKHVHCGFCAEPAPDSDPGAITASRPLATDCENFLPYWKSTANKSLQCYCAGA